MIVPIPPSSVRGTSGNRLIIVRRWRNRLLSCWLSPDDGLTLRVSGLPRIILSTIADLRCDNRRCSKCPNGNCIIPYRESRHESRHPSIYQRSCRRDAGIAGHGDGGRSADFGHGSWDNRRIIVSRFRNILLLRRLSPDAVLTRPASASSRRGAAYESRHPSIARDQADEGHEHRGLRARFFRQMAASCPPGQLALADLRQHSERGDQKSGRRMLCQP